MQRPSPTSTAGTATRRVRMLIAAGIGVAALVGGGIYWFVTRNIVTTDDAFIDGDAMQIAPRVGGPVVELRINDNQAVKQGDLLLRIDPRDYAVAVENARAALAAAVAQAAMAQANLDLTRATVAATLAQATSAVDRAKAATLQSQAQVSSAEAEQVRARQDAVRYSQLVRDEFASKQRNEQASAQSRGADAQLRASHEAVKMTQGQLGEAEAQLEAARTGPQQVAVREAQARTAEAQVGAAQAALDQAELNLSYTSIYAPHDGVVTKRAVREGDVVQRDQQLGALVFGTPWVTANFKETQLTYMRPGQPVEITVDAYPGVRFSGHVDSIQRGTGARFTLLPPENATGNFVKVVQRVPVKIVFDTPTDGHVLSLGMSVIPRVDLVGDPVGAPSAGAAR
jgi:membrane fusion protein (multidrug efflux system)